MFSQTLLRVLGIQVFYWAVELIGFIRFLGCVGLGLEKLRVSRVLKGLGCIVFRVKGLGFHGLGFPVYLRGPNSCVLIIRVLVL